MSRPSTVQERHPEFFIPERNLDRGHGQRTVPMEVLNLGFPRTGTMSMQAAFNILGLECYHSTQWFSNISDTVAWNAAQDAKFFGQGPLFTRVQWDALLGTFGAVSADAPAIAFAEDLISIYPEAKVILVHRDIEAWYRSFDNALIEAFWSPFLHFLSDWDPWLMGRFRDCHHRWIRGWWKANSKEEMQAKARMMYREHYELVRKITPKERLLEYRLGDGWEPLCRFLGKEVPDVEFPKVNDSENIKELIGLMAKKSMKNVSLRVLKWATPVMVVGLGYWLSKSS